MALKGHLDWASFKISALLLRGARVGELRNKVDDLAYAHARWVSAMRGSRGR